MKTDEDAIWKPRRVVGKKKGIPETSCPPLGEHWDRLVTQAEMFSRSGILRRSYFGVFKEGKLRDRRN